VASDGSVTLDAMMKVGVRGPPDVSALASLGTNALQVMAWNYHDDDVPGPEAAVTLGIRGLPPGRGEVRVTRYSIDADHSNAFTAWRRLGSPPAPTPEQFRRIEAAGRLSRVDFPSAARVDGGAATLLFTLSRQAVSLFVLEWDAQLGPNPQPVTNSGPPGPVVLTGL